ncbi:SRPBCC domain-containing protein [Streptosporangium roseum]|uniref:SRPBCC domain-containing protein n=1 Tax=Streptosporangium roseum TaxID=2001 RepID=UPI00331E10E5
MISIAERIAVPSPPARVWEVISDPAQVVSCISGAELGAAHDDGSFDGTLVVKFGAVRVKFAARVTLELAADELEGRLAARGRDGQRATRFTAEATFRVRQDAGSDDALVDVRGEIAINGKLATLIESGAGAVVTRMTREFSEQLIQLCAGPAAVTVEAGTAAAIAETPRPTGLFARLRAWWVRHFTRTRKAGNAHAQAE